jgi:hypothetical protein
MLVNFAHIRCYGRNQRLGGAGEQTPSECMFFISITRLRVRSIRFLPFFVLYTYRSLRQVKTSSGFQCGGLLADRSWTFWTMTAWDNQESMRRFMTTGSHGAAMPRLLNWCDEASVVHWEQAEADLPSWTKADQRMRASGRVSKVRNPSPRQATLTYRTPRVSTGVAIRPAKK